MSVTTTPYADLGAVKRALALTNTVEDTWLSELLVEAQASIDEFVGYAFQQDGTLASPTTRVFDVVADSPRLWIDECLSFSQVTEVFTNTFLGQDGIWHTTTTSTIDITADCYLLPYNQSPQYQLARISDFPFWAGRQRYKVVGVWGFASVPSDITRACIRLVIHWYKMLSTNYSDQVADGQFGKKIKFVPEMPDDVEELLCRHQHHWFLAR